MTNRTPRQKQTVRLFNQTRFKGIDMAALQKVAEAVLQTHMQQPCEVSVTFIDPEEIAGLNEQYIQHEGVTDVITFNLGSAADGILVGDIYICPHVAEEHARMYGCTTGEELARLVIHGVLHFCGFDDATEEQKKAMHRMENYFLENYWLNTIYYE